MRQRIPAPGNQALVKHKAHHAGYFFIAEQIVKLHQRLSIEAKTLASVHRRSYKYFCHAVP
jgi:hypothetical protein